MSKRITKIFAIMYVLMMAFCLCAPLNVYAAATTTVTISGDDVGKMTNVFTKLASNYNDNNDYVTVESNQVKLMGSSGSKSTEVVLSWDSPSLQFDGEVFEDADKKAKRTFMKAFTEELTKQELSTTCRQNIADKFVEGSNQTNSYLIGMTFDETSADIFTAMKWLSPILQFLRIIIGVGAIIIVLLLIASTVMDCIYIGLPMWRENQSGGQNGGSGKPFGVSMDAISTVKEVESDTGGKYRNPYIVYFKRRALTYLVLAFCVLYLIIGELGGLMQGLLNLVSGFTA